MIYTAVFSLNSIRSSSNSELEAVMLIDDFRTDGRRDIVVFINSCAGKQRVLIPEKSGKGGPGHATVHLVHGDGKQRDLIKSRKKRH